MARIMDLFKILIIVQLFYSFAITTYIYGIPDEAKNYITSFSEVTDTVNLDTFSTEIENNLRQQTDIPVIDIGSLVFYSSNILIDLLVNFAFAIPQMLALLINGIMMLFNVDSQLFIFVELVSGVIIMVMYFLGIIQLLTGLRSGRLV